MQNKANNNTKLDFFFRHFVCYFCEMQAQSNQTIFRWNHSPVHTTAFAAHSKRNAAAHRQLSKKRSVIRAVLQACIPAIRTTCKMITPPVCTMMCICRMHNRYMTSTWTRFRIVASSQPPTPHHRCYPNSILSSVAS